MSDMTKEDLVQALTTLQEVAKLVVEIVELKGTLGMPSGHLYAELMGHLSVETYSTLIEVLVQAGRLEKRGDLLFVGKKRRA